MTNIVTIFTSVHAVQRCNLIVMALMLMFLASKCVFAQENGEARKVLRGKAAIGGRMLRACVG